MSYQGLQEDRIEVSRSMNLKRKVAEQVFKYAALVSPYWKTQLRFRYACGHFVDLKNPTSFSEKLSWLKLRRYAHDPLVRQCADKLRVRDYVKEKGLEELLIPLLGVYQRPEDIDWTALPNQFVLKWNFGCGFNLFCRDLAQFDTVSATRQLKQWKRNRFWMEYAELQYRGVKKRILCEPFLDTPNGQELLDYKFYCFHGKPLAVLVIARPEEGEKAAVFMSPQWELISDIPARYRETLQPPRPETLSEMLRAARILSEPFPFVRIDFYEHNGKSLLGEMTFTPGAGIFPSETSIQGKPMGDYIHLNLG